MSDPINSQSDPADQRWSSIPLGTHEVAAADQHYAPLSIFGANIERITETDAERFFKARNKGIGVGWKLHVNLDATNPRVRTEAEKVIESLTQQGIGFGKLGEGGGTAANSLPGKEMTFSAGTLDNAMRAAGLIEAELGAHIKPPGPEQRLDDVPFGNAGVWGRFDIQKVLPDYLQYGLGGLPVAEADFLSSVPDEEKRNRSFRDLAGRLGYIFTGTNHQVDEMLQRWQDEVAPHADELRTQVGAHEANLNSQTPDSTISATTAAPEWWS